MIIICSASADTYITDKIINEQLRVRDANVGRASTLDLFKLYNETKSGSLENQTELTRALLKFDLSPITELTASILDLNSSKFKATLELKDIMTGHAVPRNFTLSVFSLSQSFDEGVGIDTGANFITASYGTANVLWFVSGANKGGLINSDDIDYITSGNLSDGNGTVSFEKKQLFEEGTEDLAIDITTLVSATIANQIPDKGFRLSFTGSEETDIKSRFVKRFASRHVSNQVLRPRIVVRFDDAIQDENFYFDTSGSLFLNSYNRSGRANLVSGSSLSDIMGNNCFVLNLSKDLFNFYVTGSQHTQGTDGHIVSGVYSASFALSSVEAGKYTKTRNIAQLLSEKGEVTFTTFWKSIDGTVAYHTGSVTIKSAQRNSAKFISREPMIILSNVDRAYHKKDTVRFRLFGRDLIGENNQSTKTPYRLKSIIYDEVYYQVADRVTEKVILEYDKINKSTLVSTDSDGMFFDFKMQALVPGRSYAFDFYIVDRGISYLFKNRDAFFVVKD